MDGVDGSDILRRSLAPPAVDRIGHKWGWKIEQRQNLARVAAAVVRGEPVAVYQDAGRPNWWEPFGGWPHHFERLTAVPEQVNWKALLVISDRALGELPHELRTTTLVYRPPSLAIGVGCQPSVSAREIEGCVVELFSRQRLSLSCLTAVGTVSHNKEEDGLVEFAERHQIPLLPYDPERFKLVRPQPASSVCEPAAMLAAGVRELVVAEAHFGSVTLAVARRPLA